MIDVAIIGAGFAGLAAAKRLTEAGRRVALFEAMDRVGGRAWTVITPDGTVIDKGAQFVGRAQYRLRALLAEHGCTLFTVRADPGVISLVQGQRTTGAHGFLSDRFNEAIVTAGSEDGISLQDWMDSLSLTPREAAMMRSGIEELWGRSPADLSYRTTHARMADETGSTDNTLEWCCHQGLGTLADRMAAPMRDHIRLNTPVTAVDRVQGGFSVTAGGTTLARQVIVAVPGPVMGHIDWRAPQDAWVRGVPNQFAGGWMIKVVLTYVHAFWRGTDFGWLGQVDDPPGLCVLDGSDLAGGMDALVIFAGGTAAARWKGLPEAQVLAEMLDILAPLTGEGIRAHTDAVLCDWTGHPWCGGGYNSWPRPWVDADPVAQLLAPHGGLHFAGAELATDYRGYIEGALQTGTDAATRILEEAT